MALATQSSERRNHRAASGEAFDSKRNAVRAAVRANDGNEVHVNDDPQPADENGR